MTTRHPLDEQFLAEGDARALAAIGYSIGIDLTTEEGRKDARALIEWVRTWQTITRTLLHFVMWSAASVVTGILAGLGGGALTYGRTALGLP